MDLGTRIRSIRIAMGLTQRAISDKTGLKSWFLSQIERQQRTPSLPDLEKICEAFDMNVVDVLEPVSYITEEDETRGASPHVFETVAPTELEAEWLRNTAQQRTLLKLVVVAAELREEDQLILLATARKMVRSYDLSGSQSYSKPS